MEEKEEREVTVRIRLVPTLIAIIGFAVLWATIGVAPAIGVLLIVLSATIEVTP